jgi:hypothetical protein
MVIKSGYNYESAEFPMGLIRYMTIYHEEQIRKRELSPNKSITACP